MRPVYQTRFGAPAGNCVAAALATILEVPIEEVPDLQEQLGDWPGLLARWLALRGLWLIWVEGWGNRLTPDTPPPGVPYLAAGRSPRGPWGHMVVYQDGQLVHDPHPEGGGLVDNILDGVGFVLPLPGRSS